MGRRRLAVGLWLAGLVFCVWQVAHTRFVADLSAFLPAAPTPEQRFIVDQLRQGAVSRVMLIGIDGADAQARADISRSIAKALELDPQFASVANGASTGSARERELLFAHRYALSPKVTPERFTVEGLNAAVADTVDMLASGAGLLVKTFVPRDPTGEFLAVLDGLLPTRTPRSENGVWVSPDGKRAVLIARTRASGSDVDGQRQAMRAVETVFAEASSRVGATDSSLLLTGPGVFSVRSREAIGRDVERLALAAALAVASILLLAYRSPTALALGLAPVVSGALAGVTAVSLAFGMVHGITLGFGTTLIGEAVDYSIYQFVQAKREGSDGDGAWVSGFWPTVRLGVLTSIAGFCALLLSGLPGLAQLGLYSIAGLVVAAAVTRYVLPALRPAGFRIRDLAALGARLVRFATLAVRFRWMVTVLAVVALAALVAHHETLWDRELDSLNPIPMADLARDAELRGALGAPDARLVIAVTAASADAALVAAEGVGKRLDALVSAQRLGGYETPARLLPSAETQRARLASLPEPEVLRARLQLALARSQLKPDKLEPFIADVAKARTSPLVTRETFNGTGFDALLDGLLFADRSGRWTAVIGLTPLAGGVIDPRTVRDAVGQQDDVAVIDFKAEVARLYSGYLERAQLASMAATAAIVLLLLGALGSPARVGRVLAPLAAAVLVVAAFHVLVGTRLSLMHLIGLVLVVAIGSNYALFFDRMTEVRDGSAGRTLASLALANATTVTSFGILALSGIRVLSAIGSTVALGTLSALVFAAMLVRFERSYERTDRLVP